MQTNRFQMIGRCNAIVSVKGVVVRSFYCTLSCCDKVNKSACPNEGIERFTHLLQRIARRVQRDCRASLLWVGSGDSL